MLSTTRNVVYHGDEFSRTKQFLFSKSKTALVVGVDKTWARAHGLAHGLPYRLPYGLPYFDDFIISQ